MWDPFRYKLGGRLLNGNGEEFTERYGSPEGGRYVITRDAATYAITKEVAAGRGSPAGGAYLSFEHLSEATLNDAFGPVIKKLKANGIDLTQMPIEVSPIAHYHMGGIAVDDQMHTGLAGLFAAGEAVGGANGANRLSGNAITEALVFGKRAGQSAAQYVAQNANLPTFSHSDAEDALGLVLADHNATNAPNTAAMIAEMQAAMSDHAGPFKTEASLGNALSAIADLEARLGDCPPGTPGAFDPQRIDWFDLRNMLLVARVVAEAALARTESRGAHQREDYPGMLDDWCRNQFTEMQNGRPTIARGPVLNRPETAA
jgi:succinate dehydrogenase/fumarate reductase flavoprotein subunit